jgi:uncharacterized membrane protein
MAKDVTDVGDVIGSAVGKIAREAAHSVSGNGRNGLTGKSTNGALSGMRGVAAGVAAAAAAAPLVAKGAGKLVKGAGKRVASPAKDATEKVGGKAKEAVGEKIDEAGGAGGVAKEAGKSLIPGVGSKGGDQKGGDQKGGGQKGTPGVGKGRRMPVQQAVDVAVPLQTAYNQWTQFEEWPQFMHRLDQATQEEDATVSFRTKVWGMSREFEGQIVQQRPDERIMWNVSKGVQHTGVVTFHELAPRLTRIQVSLDVEPGSLLEKAARGMRHMKRAVRADLARFKAFIEMQEVETGAWRGVIEDGEVVQEHPSNYDGGRDYADFEDIHDREHSHTPQTGSGNGSSASGRSTGSSRKSSGGSSGSRSRGSSRKRGGASAKGRSTGSSKGRSTGSSRKRSGSGSGRSSSGGRSRSRSGSGSGRQKATARSRS